MSDYSITLSNGKVSCTFPVNVNSLSSAKAIGKAWREALQQTSFKVSINDERGVLWVI